MGRFRTALAVGCAAFVMAAGAGGTAHAASTETVLHNFSNTTGKSPMTGPVFDASTGAVYGATWEGGQAAMV